MSKSTPGPWTLFNGTRGDVHLPMYRPSDSCRVILNKDGVPLAEIRLGNAEANAQLIAAAPELLEAAIQAITIPLIFLDQIQDIKLRQQVADAYNKLALAINKAEGKE